MVFGAQHGLVRHPGGSGLMLEYIGSGMML